MPELLHKELTGAIIGAYYEVYNHTSRTYPEYIYESALMEELRLRGYPSTRQDEYQIFYKERLAGVQRLDLFVVQEIVVENKVAEQLTSLNKAQGYSYLKTVGKAVGLLFNFGSNSPEFERLYFDPARRESMPPDEKVLQRQVTQSADWLYPDLAYAVVGGLYEVHNILGPGFVHRIYANACYRELQLRGLAVKPAKRMQVTYKGMVIGDVAFRHILVEDKAMVFPVAIRDIRGIHLDNLKDWMRTCGIQLGILANFNAVRLDVVFVRA
jgi:GxxExxY protein